MRISFHGAAREVTGSCHLLEVGDERVLLDCGLHQGGRERHQRNREQFPFSAADLAGVVLSHAHVDHCGRLPLLVKSGFAGPILCTEATAQLCEIMLRDSAHLQEEDARWKIKRLRKAGEDSSWVEPLYTIDDVEATLGLLRPFEFDEPLPVARGVSGRFVIAGHILGAAIVELEVRERGRQRRVVFSGDLGVSGARLLGPPRAVEAPDYLLIESTYGDRSRADEGEPTERLFEIISTTIEGGGKVIIPAFAVGRTQEILSRVNDLVEGGRLCGVPVFVDSPMAVKATTVFRAHPDCYSEEARDLLLDGDLPLQFPGLELVRDVEHSKRINTDPRPSVIISASGMCDGGRVKHHLKNYLGDPRCTVLFVGYQAAGSLGRAIESGGSPVRIFGQRHAVRARIESLHGLSAHADREGLLGWYASLDGNPRRCFVVHGDEEAALAFTSCLESQFAADAVAPKRGEAFELD